MRLEDLIPNASSFLPGGIRKEASDVISTVYFHYNPQDRENRDTVEMIKRKDKNLGITTEILRDGFSLLTAFTGSYKGALGMYIVSTYIMDRVFYSMKKDKWIFLV